MGGILFWGAFNTALEFTNTEKFCTSCHEMRDNPYQELQPTIHFTNRSGVRANAPTATRLDQQDGPQDAGVQGGLGLDLRHHRHRDEFLEKRLELARREWSRLKANDSLECRNCHLYDSMDFTRQSRRASFAHATALDGSKTCIDCHKGIAHRLPNMAEVLP